MLPLHDTPGVRLRGEVFGSHRGPLALVLTEEAARTGEIVLDLTDVHFVSNSILDILTVLASRLVSPQCLLVKASADLKLRERTDARGWNEIATVRLEES
ncbi:hypothetical protein [Streptomyces formicae]|uniref:STAS domain-containing protein n=1 Tax=Streptomyces formicae TaxID=1616117 RepID=A0A291QLP1_9ACTN|nr:hypothetical protein [Streptomyces formicae]ATL32621.1 hypothetical protein KY5_7603c [Streptomyces formicae]